MKILCVIDSLGSGGAQRQLVNLAISFKDMGHEVSFLVYHSDSFYSKELLLADIPIITVIEPSRLKRIFRIRSIIRKSQYDAILSFLESPNLICELASFPTKSWKLVVGERSANPKIKTSFKLRAYRIFHLIADAVVANSYTNVDLVKQVNPLLPNSKCHVIYNIIDFNQWQPKAAVSEKVEKKRLIVAARHNYLKNLNGLIEAVNLLNSSEKDRLIIEWYGRKDHDSSYDKAIEKIKNYRLEDNFRFYPPTLNIHQKVNSADIVGLFSFYEGLPNIVCEGMVNEKVIIASDISDISKMIDSEFIFDPNDYNEICNVLRYALNLPENTQKKIARKNRLKGLELFNKKEIVQKYLDLLS